MLVVSVLEISLQANQRSMASNVSDTEWMEAEEHRTKSEAWRQVSKSRWNVGGRGGTKRGWV